MKKNAATSGIIATRHLCLMAAAAAGALIAGCGATPAMIAASRPSVATAAAAPTTAAAAAPAAAPAPAPPPGASPPG